MFQELGEKAPSTQTPAPTSAALPTEAAPPAQTSVPAPALAAESATDKPERETIRVSIYITAVGASQSSRVK